MLTNPWMLVGQPRQEHVVRQSRQTGQSIQGVHPAERLPRLGRQLRQQRHCGFVLPLIEQPRRRVAMPAVGMCEQGHQLGRRCAAQLGQLRLPEAVGDNPVEPPLVAAAGQVEVLLDDRRQAGRMLDHFAVHVEDVQRAVRSVRELHGPEPVVAGRNELSCSRRSACR